MILKEVNIYNFNDNKKQIKSKKFYCVKPKTYIIPILTQKLNRKYICSNIY